MDKIKKHKLTEILNNKDAIPELLKIKNNKELEKYLCTKGINLNENDLKEIYEAAQKSDEFQKKLKLNSKELDNIVGGANESKFRSWLKELSEKSKPTTKNLGYVGDVHKLLSLLVSTYEKNFYKGETFPLTILKGILFLGSVGSTFKDGLGLISSLSKTLENNNN